MPRNNSYERTIWDQITAERLEDINKDLDVLYIEWSDRLKVWKTTGLSIQIGAGNYRIWSAEWIFAGSTETLADDTISYVMLTGSWTINISTTGWDANYVRLAKVTTVSWQVTVVEMRKPDAVGWILGWGWFKNITSITKDIGWFITSLIADWITWNITYHQDCRINTMTNWTNVYTVQYDEYLMIDWVLES